MNFSSKAVLPEFSMTDILPPDRTGPPRGLKDSETVRTTAAHDPAEYEKLLNKQVGEPQIIEFLKPLWLCSPRGWARQVMKRCKGYVWLSAFHPGDDAGVMEPTAEMTIKITKKEDARR